MIIETADENMMDDLLRENVGVEIDLPVTFNSESNKQTPAEDQDDGSKSAYSFRSNWSSETAEMNKDTPEPPEGDLIDTSATTTAGTSDLTDADQLSKLMEKL